LDGYGGKLTLVLRLANFEPRSYPLGGHVLTEKLTKPSAERLAKRIHVALPIRVTYRDSANRACLEMSCTYDISERGARVGGLRCVKQKGDVIAVERGRSKAFCRVVWIGEPDSDRRGQIGIECVESDRILWEAELRDMKEAYEPFPGSSREPRRSHLAHGRRRGENRQHERFDVEGFVELLKNGSNSAHCKAVLNNLSELGCQIYTEQAAAPGTELKMLLNYGGYDLGVKGEVRHANSSAGLGIEFREIRKGDRQILQFLLRKLAEQQLENSFQLEI